MTAAADLIRATAKNRVDNHVTGASVANRRRRRSDRSRTVLSTVAVAARTVAAPQPHHRQQTVRRPTGRACGRRPVRGVGSGGGKSGLEALRAPAPWIRHRRSGQLVTETIPRCPSNPPRRRRQRQHDRRKTRFSRRRTGSRPSGRPVNRCYGHVEDVLDAGCWDIEPHMTVSEASRTVLSSRADPTSRVESVGCGLAGRRGPEGFCREGSVIHN